MQCKGCEKQSTSELCNDCQLQEKKAKFIWLYAAGWLVTGAISSALIDTQNPDAISVSLNNILSFDLWRSLNGLASLLGSITASNIPGVIVTGIISIFIKRVRSLRNFILVSASISMLFAIFLMT